MNQNNGANLGFEQKMWQAADKMRSNMDAAEYKHVVLGLIFLKYISDAFKEMYDELSKDKTSNAEDKEMPQKNLAFETLKKLLNDEIRVYSKKNIVQGKSFMEMLDKTIKKYTNRSIEAAQVIEEMIELAKKFRAEIDKGQELGLNEDEKAFYDALYVNDSAVKVLGDEALRKIALELTEVIRRNVTVDWTLRESVQAKLRVMVKKILGKYGYPPDKQKRATETVLEQAKNIAKDWAEKQG